MKIKYIQAYEVIASGGYPSLEAVVTLQDGLQASASVSYGASDGSKEAKVLLDNDMNRYLGHGMSTAVETIQNKISPTLEQESALDSRAIDLLLKTLDPTDTFAELGANTILAVSLAVARAGALCQGIPLYEHLRRSYGTGGPEYLLPNPMMVMIEGGVHAIQSTDFQEYLIAVRTKSTATESIRAGLEIYHATREALRLRGFTTNVGNEGAFAPEGITSNTLPLEILNEAIERAGYEPGIDAMLALDIAASELYEGGKYNLKAESRTVSAEELTSYCIGLKDQYPLYSIEDPLDENDWNGWEQFNQRARQQGIKTIGDDLTVSRPNLIEKAVTANAISGVIIKPNQIGTITDTMDACKLAKEYSLDVIVSHRGGGETNDTCITDIAVAASAHYLKCGPTRGERVAKYNRLMAIERELGARSHVRGDSE